MIWDGADQHLRFTEIQMLERVRVAQIPVGTMDADFVQFAVRFRIEIHHQDFLFGIFIMARDHFMQEGTGFTKESQQHNFARTSATSESWLSGMAETRLARLP